MNENLNMKKKLFAYVILDRTGSMSRKWQQAIDSINEYVATLQGDDSIEAFVEIRAFDAPATLGVSKYTPATVVYSMDSVKVWLPLTVEGLRGLDVYPRYMTNLYDSVGQVLVEQVSRDENVCIVVVTDGDENASVEFTKADIKKVTKDFTDTGKEIVFLGADFDVESSASQYGLDISKFINASVDNFSEATRNIALKSAAYASAGVAMNFTAEDKASVK